MSLILMLCALVLCVLSIRRRVVNKTRLLRSANGAERSVAPARSPLADALTEMAAIAGGIYIGITALTSFLKMAIPERVALFGVYFDPVALVALIAAICQPYFVKPN